MAAETAEFRHALEIARSAAQAFGNVRSLLEDCEHTLSRPIVGSHDALEMGLLLCLVKHRAATSEHFTSTYPGIDAGALWQAIHKDHDLMPALASMNDASLRAFVNYTAWCHTKEGTGIAGRFSIRRLAKASGKPAAWIDDCVQPALFEATCGACSARATARSFSSVLMSTARPTTIRCDHCEHTDSPARRPLGHHEARWTARIACRCTTCRDVREDVNRQMALNLERNLQQDGRELEAWSAKHLQTFAPTRDWAAPRDSKLEEAVSEAMKRGMPLQGALVTCARRQSPDLLGEAGAAALAIKTGVNEGWLKLTKSWADDTPESGIAAIEATMSRRGTYSLDQFREDCLSGDAARMMKAADQSCLSTATLLAPVWVLVRWVNATDRATEEVIHSSTLKPRPRLPAEHSPWQAATSLELSGRAATSGQCGAWKGPRHLQPPAADVLSAANADPVTSEGGQVSMDDAMDVAAQWMLAAEERVEKEFGVGSAKRAPDLVAALMMMALAARNGQLGA
jgi:hypothetical protein